jgi:glutamine transport system substrate-binding protein
MKKRWSRVGVLLLAFSMVFVLAACGNDDDTLVIGTDTSFVPFAYTNESGESEGFDIELWDAIAQEAGIEYELKPMDFGAIINDIQTGGLDGAIAGMTITDERKEKVAFAEPYYDAGLIVLVAEDETEIQSYEDLTGKTIATKTGTTGYNFASTLDAEIVPFPEIDAAYQELLNDRADAVIFDAPNIVYYIKEQGEGKVKTVGDILPGEEQYGIAFPKDSEYIDEVNEALRTVVENGTYADIYIKWFENEPTKLPFQ